MSQLGVSVIICCHNSENRISQTLNYLKRQENTSSSGRECKSASVKNSSKGRALKTAGRLQNKVLNKKRNNKRLHNKMRPNQVRLLNTWSLSKAKKPYREKRKRNSRHAGRASLCAMAGTMRRKMGPGILIVSKRHA